MIKFFRKIRQKLLSENKFSKYLIYAIGEIILVVIGILIALNINNWNENLKTKKSERVFLDRLKIDLVTDSIYFSRRIKESDEIIKNGEFFISEVYNTQQSFDEYLTLLNTYLWNSEDFVVQKTTYNELYSSGLLNIVSNNKLKNDILMHYLKYETNGSHIREANEFSVGEMSKIISILFKGWNVNTVNKELNKNIEMDWKFINDPTSKKFIELETDSAIYRDKHKTFKSYFEDSLNRIRLLIKQIDMELKSSR
ncbi:MAG: DUF6090 family protein [Saprospiraceae bacterium]|nr:DUF6090 family protein [Saprospiraceae bacterium]